MTRRNPGTKLWLCPWTTVSRSSPFSVYFIYLFIHNIQYMEFNNINMPKIHYYMQTSRTTASIFSLLQWRAMIVVFLLNINMSFTTSTHATSNKQHSRQCWYAKGEANVMAAAMTRYGTGPCGLPNMHDVVHIVLNCKSVTFGAQFFQSWAGYSKISSRFSNPSR